MKTKTTRWNGIIIPVLFCLVMAVSACKKDTASVVAPNTAPANSCSDFVAPVPTGANTVPLLVVRIQFEGELFDDNYRGDPFAFNHFQSNACIWAKKLFGNQEGQLAHYFNEVSNNGFQMVPATETHGVANDGIVTVTLPGNHPDPGDDLFPFLQKLLDAVGLVNPYVDFSSFDDNSDGKLNISELQIMFLVAGYEASSGASGPSIWAHKACLYIPEYGVYPPVLDNTEIMGCYDAETGQVGNNYSLFGERQTDAGHDATIGVIAHELGHAALDLPDLYDTDRSSAGIGFFGLMGAGSWGEKSGDYPGATPVHPTAWTKLKNEWYIADTSASGSTSLPANDQLGYKIVKLSISSTEYFLLENRGTAGYDQGLALLDDPYTPSSSFQGGLAIWHVDDNEVDNDNEYRKLVDLEEADDGGLDSKQDYGVFADLFWNGNNSDFNNTTNPNSKTYSGALSGIAVNGISARGNTMNVTITP
ncbi:MAG: M6 family metalloprotease domain-containing protein [Proteobacteria bacterium]|nr:M6 family metalloprotease domain-containing protein [Pseudomonadota bacterium]